jgi:hypothetical protein
MIFLLVAASAVLGCTSTTSLGVDPNNHGAMSFWRVSAGGTQDLIVTVDPHSRTKEICPLVPYLVSVEIETSGAVRWNGPPISSENFDRYLLETQERNPMAWFAVASGPQTRADLVTNVLHQIQQRGFRFATATCPPVIY